MPHGNGRWWQEHHLTTDVSELTACSTIMWCRLLLYAGLPKYVALPSPSNAAEEVEATNTWLRKCAPVGLAKLDVQYVEGW